MEPPVTDAVWLTGKQVAFSGQLAAMSRAEAVRLVQACGGVVARTVSENTSYLVVGQKAEPLAQDGRPAPRIRMATRLQRQGVAIQILSEEEFLKRSGVESSRRSRAAALFRIPRLSHPQHSHGAVIPVAASWVGPAVQDTPERGLFRLPASVVGEDTVQPDRGGCQTQQNSPEPHAARPLG